MTGIVLLVVTDPLGYGVGALLKKCDFEAFEGQGAVEMTLQLEEAIKFPDGEAAEEYWKTQSRTMPLRLDGHPNCPLRGFSITAITVEDARALLPRLQYPYQQGEFRGHRSKAH